jgi:hypothetical protein
VCESARARARLRAIPTLFQAYGYAAVRSDWQDLAGRVMMENGIVQVQLECEYQEILATAAFCPHCSISPPAVVRIPAVRREGETDA